MGGGERHTVGARHLNDDRGGRFGGKSMHGLKLDHPMPKSSDNAPATSCGSRRHRRRADNDDPGWDLEFWRMEKVEFRREVRESAAGRASKERQRDDAHGFLSVVGSVAVSHPGRAK